MEADQRQIFLVLMGIRNLKVRAKGGVTDGGCEEEGLMRTDLERRNC